MRKVPRDLARGMKEFFREAVLSGNWWDRFSFGSDAVYLRLPGIEVILPLPGQDQLLILLHELLLLQYIFQIRKNSGQFQYFQIQ